MKTQHLFIVTQITGPSLVSLTCVMGILGEHGYILQYVALSQGKNLDYKR